MSGLVLLVVGIAVLICGYIFYGRWLCKQWGVGDSTEPTPAHTLRDDVDYVPAPAAVLMGHLQRTFRSRDQTSISCTGR